MRITLPGQLRSFKAPYVCPFFGTRETSFQPRLQKNGYFSRYYLLIIIGLFSWMTGHAQKTIKIKEEKCGTMPRLEALFEQNPQFRKRFELERARFAKAVREGAYRLSKANREDGTARTVYTIPVVFHIVLQNPNQVTDAQILAQLDTLNKDYFGENGDSLKIPSYFKNLFGKSSIQFCLARRTPDGENTSGIERITTATSSFSTNDDVKHTVFGGADIWDGNKYFNVWITSISGGILGYATFPNDGSPGNNTDPSNQGVVVDYRSLPGGSFAAYNGGKTLSHETGHYFNLFHIWGDDDGKCTGSDDVDDTPNQADATSGCYTGIKTDSCTPGGNGIMYQNYMDYSDDDCLVMFTNGQVARMESALLAYRSSLITSNGCTPPVPTNYNVRLRAINQPTQRLCSSTFAPEITIKNLGSQTLTSLTITTTVDNAKVATYNWTGNLAQGALANITLNNVTVTPGVHTLTFYVTNPNNHADEDVSNDTLSRIVQYFEPVTEVKESFENSTFPPPGWDIINNDGGITWERVTGIAKTGMASVMINNFDNEHVGQNDDLRLPVVNLPSTLDSAFFSFQVAAATYTNTNTRNNPWDTLQVLISTDCGQTYTSLYKKWGGSLVTRTLATTDAFVPTADEWRKDSIDLAPYIGQSNILLVFRNTTGFENNVYLDDVNLRTVVVNPNLKAAGVLVTPSPTTGNIAVQFYPQPENLRSIEIFSSTGQKLAETIISRGANNFYSYDLSRYPAGTYIVRTVFTNKVVIRRVVKL